MCVEEKGDEDGSKDSVCVCVWEVRGHLGSHGCKDVNEAGDRKRELVR